MTEQYPLPPEQTPPANLVPPKPTISDPPIVFGSPYPTAEQSTAPQAFGQTVSPDGSLSQVSIDQVYPTPPPEQVPPVQQFYQQQPPQQYYQQPYEQGLPQQPLEQPFQQQPYQQPYQQPPYEQPFQPVPPQAGPPNQQLPTPPYEQPFQQAGQPYQQPYQQPFQQAPNQNLPYQQPWQYGNTPLPQTNNFVLFLILSIISFLFCGGLIAVPAFVSALQMNTAYKQGNGELYLKHKKSSRTWLIIAFCVGAVVNVLYLVFSINTWGGILN